MGLTAQQLWDLYYTILLKGLQQQRGAHQRAVSHR